MTSLLVSPFDMVLRCSAEASVMAGLILLVQLVFKSFLTPRIRYSLWLLLLLKLTLPISVPSGLSVYNLFKIHQPKSLESRSPSLGRATAQRSDESFQSVSSSPALLTSTASSIVPANAPKPPGRVQPSARKTIIYLWILGVGIALLRFLIPNLTFVFRFRTSRQPLRSDDQKLFERCRTKAGVHRFVRAWCTSLVKTPAAFGLFRGEVLIPADLAASSAELEYVFLHELGHVKNRDLFYHCIASIVWCLHWFNPVLAFCWRRMEKDRELACDSWVLNLDQTKPDLYAATLLKVIEAGGKQGRITGMAMAESVHGVEERLKAIMSYSTPRPSLLVFASALTGMLGLLTLTSAQVESSNVKQSSQLRPAVPNLASHTDPPATNETVNVSVQLIDSELEKPLAGEIIVRTTAQKGGTKEPAFRTNCPISGISFKISNVYTYEVEVHSGHYSPKLTGPIGLNQGDKELEFRLQTGRHISGVVLTPTGRPVGSAQVAFAAPGFRPMLYERHIASQALDGHLDPLPYSRIVFTDKNGRFDYWTPDPLLGILAVNDFGIGITIPDATAEEVSILLEPWKGVGGHLYLEGKPGKTQEVLLTNPGGIFEMDWQSFSAVTDSDGGFFFRSAPPGHWTLAWNPLGPGPRKSWSHGIPVTIAAGKNKHVNFALEGTSVRGALRSTVADVDVDWSRAHVGLRPLRDGKPQSTPSYVGVTDERGTFQVPMLPPGKYQLTAFAFNRATYAEGPVGGKVRFFTTNLTVSSSSDTIDLGIIPLEVQ